MLVLNISNVVFVTSLPYDLTDLRIVNVRYFRKKVMLYLEI